MSLVLWFKDCSYENKNLVGGKVASLGCLYKLSQKYNFMIGDGFAITINFYNLFLEQNGLTTIIKEIVEKIDCDNIEQLEHDSCKLRHLIEAGVFTTEQEELIKTNYNVENLINFPGH